MIMSEINHVKSEIVFKDDSQKKLINLDVLSAKDFKNKNNSKSLLSNRFSAQVKIFEFLELLN